MKLKDNSAQEIDTALYQLEQRLKSNIRLTDVENSNASSAKINAVDKKLTEEVKDRQSADEKLQDNINKEIADRQEADAAIENAKQDKLIAGNNIQIDGNVISATSTEYTAEAPVKVTDGKISLDTVPVNKGGTGVTTQADINKAFIGNLDVGNSDVTDGTEFVSSWASDNGFAETTEGAVNTPYRRKFIKVWGYIKDKISSVLGLTKDNYGGTAATILDYVRGTPIKVRWYGAGINSAEWYPAFNADGSALEPINRANICAGTAESATKAVSVVDYGDTSRTIKIGFYGTGATVDNLAYVAGYLSGGNQIKDVNKDVLQSWLNLLQLSGGTMTGKLDVKTAGIRIPTSQPSSLSNGDIWVE